MHFEGLATRSLTLTLCAVLTACVAGRAAIDTRDMFQASSGSNLRLTTRAVVFVHDEPGLAAGGRDYVYLQPLSVTRNGERSLWLWVGVWSTVDRQARDARASPLQLGPIHLLADGEPIAIASVLAESNPAGLTELPYTTPVMPAQQFMARVTPSLLARLARANTLVLVDAPNEGTVRRWRATAADQTIIRNFVTAVGL